MSVMTGPDVMRDDRPEAIASRSPMSGAVLAMTLCAVALIASEFLPVSLLTPVASDLRLTEGQAGQAISVSGIFAVLTSLFVSAAAVLGSPPRPAGPPHSSWSSPASVVAFAPNFRRADSREGAARRGHRRLLVDVHGNRDAAGAAQRRAEGACAPEWRQCARGDGGRATRQFPRRHHRMAGCLLLRRASRGDRLCLAAGRCLPCHAESPTGASAIAASRLLGRSPRSARHARGHLFLFMGQFALFTYLRPFLEAESRAPTLRRCPSVLADLGRDRPCSVPMRWAGSLRKGPHTVLVAAIPLAHGRDRRPR